MLLIRKVSKVLEQAIQNTTKVDKIQLERPKALQFGDLTTNIAMRLASEKKQSPIHIAKEIVDDLNKQADVVGVCEKIEVVSPGFINFYIKSDLIQVELDVIYNTSNYGSSEAGKGKKVVIEYSSPNTNKPIHVGHLRNNALGMSLANILEFTGFEVVKTQVINDRGVHIMKSLLAYQKWGNNKTPEDTGQKGDRFVADYYVMFGKQAKNNPQLEEEAQNLLKAWEEGDEKVVALWKKMNKWVYDGWQETYNDFGSVFDKEYFESDLYTKGREIVERAYDKNIVKKNSEGAYVIDLSEENLGGRESGEKVLLRSNGTTVYITQDIYLAVSRFEDYHFDKMIYVVGDEQLYHFKVLFTILKKLGYDWVVNLLHYPYAHVLLPEGKMKSREGKVVDADDLISEMRTHAYDEIEKRRDDISEDEKNKNASIISMAAIKYWFLKNNQKTSIIFDPKQSLDFEGNTGPYLLYTYVRLGSVISKHDKIKNYDTKLLGEKEKEIVRLMIQWPLVVDNFLNHYQHNFICEYLFELASKINSYYHDVSILKSEDGVRETRLALIISVRSILKTGLNLLNINIIEKM